MADENTVEKFAIKNEDDNLISTKIKMEPIDLINESEIKKEINFKEEKNLKVFRTLLNLGSIHHKIKIEDYSESACDLKNESDGALVEDPKVDHKMCTSEKVFKCKTCSKTFANSRNLGKHEKTHTGKKPYKCNICAKTFTLLGYLKQHEKIHTGERPYKCNTCAITFTRLSDLKQHEKIHTGQKPYKCNTCAKTFTRSHHLKEHEKIHTGEKPYKCNTCAKTFTQLDNLNSHKRIHSAKKP